MTNFKVFNSKPLASIFNPKVASSKWVNALKKYYTTPKTSQLESLTETGMFKPMRFVIDLHNRCCRVDHVGFKTTLKLKTAHRDLAPATGEHFFLNIADNKNFFHMGTDIVVIEPGTRVELQVRLV